MSKKYHISKNGEPAVCYAKVSCRLGDSSDHFPSPEEARAAYEIKQTTQISTIKTVDGTVTKYVSRSVLNIDDEANSGKKVVVLSDVDGTLLKGSLVLEHACLLHKDGVIDLGSLPEQWAKDKKNEELITALAEKYREEIIGMTLEELELDSFVNSLTDDSNNFYSSIVEIKELKAKGAEVVLISGSPEFLVKKLAKKYGFKGVGSKYFRDKNGKFTGEIQGMFFAGAKEKVVDGLVGKRKDSIIIHSYGDTASDGPLFAVADHKTIVDPTDATLGKLNISPEDPGYRIVRQ